MDAQSAGLPRKRQLRDNVTERVANATARPFSTPRLAEAVFVSRTAVSKWESGRGYPSIDSFKELLALVRT